MPAFRRCPASAARENSLFKGRPRVSQAYFRFADCCSDGRDGSRRHAARGAGLGLSDQSDADRPARDAARRPTPLWRSPSAAGRPQVSAHGRGQPRSQPQRHSRHRRQGTRRSRSASISATLCSTAAASEFGARRRDPRRGRPRDAPRSRRRRLHPGGLGLHGRDPRPRDRRTQRRTT